MFCFVVSLLFTLNMDYVGVSVCKYLLTTHGLENSGPESARFETPNMYSIYKNVTFLFLTIELENS
jgi:hypothetical protein